MPAEDQMTFLTGLGSSAQNGSIAFTTTHWSVVLEAQGRIAGGRRGTGKFAALIGGRYTDLLGEEATSPKKRRI